MTAKKPENIKKLKPDTVLKNYWHDNERFADLFNAVLFDGSQVIRPDELEDIDSEGSYVLEHRDYAESIEAARDNIKIRKKSAQHGVELVMMGIESQEHIHYAMPLRVMGYDYSIYKKQYNNNAARYKTSDGLDSDEYLSRMKRTDKFIPVITLVVYYGEKSWDGATSLHEMLLISKEMKRYVNNYKMLLVEARKNDLALHHKNNVDLFNILAIVLDQSLPKKEAREKAIQYDEEHKPDKAVILAIAGATNSKIDYNAFEKKEDGRMCTLFEEIAKESQDKGMTKGQAKEIVESGFEFHLSENDILNRLQTKLNISFQKAQEYFNMFKNPAV